MNEFEQKPSSPLRDRTVLLSYWVLFIFLPLTSFIVWRGIAAALPLVLPLFLVLVLLGEHGFRLWKRLWRML